MKGLVSYSVGASRREGPTLSRATKNMASMSENTMAASRAPYGYSSVAIVIASWLMISASSCCEIDTMVGEVEECGRLLA